MRGSRRHKDARIVREIELKQFDGDLLLIGYPEKRGDQNIHRYYRENRGTKCCPCNFMKEILFGN